ncbi:MAG: hypothetical protein K6G74_00465 [Bacilli bacterium]|nr:hypothetical protein [Bacilli bacterium]
MQIGERIEKGCRFIDIRNETGMEITLCDFGASIYEIKINGHPMTIANRDIEKWMYSRSYFGKTVGRIAGRVGNATLTLNGEDYHLEANEGKNTLHMGKDALCYKPWIYDVHMKRGAAHIDYYYHLMDGEEGLPGEQMINVRYIIHKKENVFDILFYAGKPTKDTYTRLTNHAYFNLGGYKNIRNHKFTLDADRVSLFDEGCIATDFVKVPSNLDFRKGVSLDEALPNKDLAKLPTGGLDHVFIRTNAKCSDYRKDKTGMEKPLLTLESPLASLQIFTTFPAITCYADNFPGGGTLTNGNEEEKYAGLALEPRFDDMDVIKPGAFQKKGRLQVNMITYAFKIK